ncbi:hypothetical protein E2R51_19520 [Jeotgalibacillus sp. S-D1]|uniref:hypothetical protein n=1 Tax=Jeotgalibacillus sp. S-D1 TaxID=2552189 RepID=UPI00105981AF|nr:hypothetical protein [Jeotgalibacillus sp. S-D1]TDL30255.1 hypothetical protein E2R51_19520 [Jeotgalibacillus sp. S-D1]
MTTQETPSIRVNLSLKPDLNDLIEELSELSGQSKAGFIRNFLQEMKPALEITRDGLKVIKDKENATNVLANMFDLADLKVDELKQHKLDLE